MFKVKMLQVLFTIELLLIFYLQIHVLRLLYNLLLKVTVIMFIAFLLYLFSNLLIFILNYVYHLVTKGIFNRGSSSTMPIQDDAQQPGNIYLEELHFS